MQNPLLLPETRSEGTHSLALYCGPLSSQDILQLGEMLDESHHLSLKTLGVNILHRRHLQGNLDVRLPLQERIRLSESEEVTRWKLQKGKILDK